MAKSIAACQQPEGYWTRSLIASEQAPGPETSGTALFTYGFLWGINNGLLNADIYSPIVEKAWNYLKTTALQADGKIGYIQPVGEKAIPGQVVDANSCFNFGIGAFLLAACERVRFLHKKVKKMNKFILIGCTILFLFFSADLCAKHKTKKMADREIWCDVMYRMAAPVLSNISEGKLQKNMQLELSPTWDGRDRRVSYMECFGRLMAGLAPWLLLPGDDTAEGIQRKQLRTWHCKDIKMLWIPYLLIIYFGVKISKHW